MRYTFVTDEDKEALFKRCYRRFQIGVAALVIALIGFILAFRAYASSHFGWVLAFTCLAVAFAQYERLRRKKDGIESVEWQSYLWRQPMMIIVSVIMVISVLVHFYQVFIAK